MSVLLHPCLPLAHDSICNCSGSGSNTLVSKGFGWCQFSHARSFCQHIHEEDQTKQYILLHVILPHPYRRVHGNISSPNLTSSTIYWHVPRDNTHSTILVYCNYSFFPSWFMFPQKCHPRSTSFDAFKSNFLPWKDSFIHLHRFFLLSILSTGFTFTKALSGSYFLANSV